MNGVFRRFSSLPSLFLFIYLSFIYLFIFLLLLFFLLLSFFLFCAKSRHPFMTFFFNGGASENGIMTDEIGKGFT